jgi:uncharacterized delta-60 repeat protein
MQYLARYGTALLTLGSVLSPALVSGQTPGTLDPSFGTGGMVTTDFGGSSAEVRALAVQPDGKIVAAGGAFVSGISDFALARYNPDGTLDGSFGIGGTATSPFDFPGSFDQVSGVVIQPDGKIVLAGSTGVNGFAVFALARYNSNGTLDAGFGTGGMMTTDFGQLSAEAFSVAVQPDGKIVLAGEANIDGGYDFALARYNSNGTLDASFGTGGKVASAFPSGQGFSFGQAFSVAVQPDGRIVAAGYAWINGGFDFAVARYNSNGTPDASFGVGGTVTTDFAGPNDHAFSIAVQPDGKLVVGGAAGGFVTRGFDFALARYNSNGTLDANFGTDGKVTTDLASVQDVPSSIALQGDGKIILVGRTSVGENENFALARYNSNGTLDTGFGTGGKVTTDFAGSTDEPSAVALQGDGNIVVAGLAENNARYDFALARYIGGAGTSGGAGTGGGTGTSAATATTLGSSINPSSVGASIVFTATISGTGPTGTVNFRDGSNSIPGCSAVALSGSGNARIASCTTASLGAGAHSVTAAYSGDATNAASISAALTQTVNKVASTTGIATSLTPSLAGSSVTFTATVSGSAPAGSVTFKDGSTSISGCSAVGLTGSGNVRTALCATASLVAGTHSITAIYTGDASNNGSTSAALSQVVNTAQRHHH